jgi:hypothetical protein
MVAGKAEYLKETVLETMQVGPTILSVKTKKELLHWVDKSSFHGFFILKATDFLPLKFPVFFRHP